MLCPGVFYIEDFNDDSMYLVEGRDKVLLIDTGSATATRSPSRRR